MFKEYVCVDEYIGRDSGVGVSVSDSDSEGQPEINAYFCFALYS